MVLVVPLNHLGDEVDADQLVVNKELSLEPFRGRQGSWFIVGAMGVLRFKVSGLNVEACLIAHSVGLESWGVFGGWGVDRGSRVQALGCRR